MHAMVDVEGKFFHLKCAPDDDPTLSNIVVDGMICASCGDVIEGDPEEDPRTLEAEAEELDEEEDKD